MDHHSQSTIFEYKLSARLSAFAGCLIDSVPNQVLNANYKSEVAAFEDIAISFITKAENQMTSASIMAGQGCFLLA